MNPVSLQIKLNTSPHPSLAPPPRVSFHPHPLSLSHPAPRFISISFCLLACLFQDKNPCMTGRELDVLVAKVITAAFLCP